MGRQAAPKPPPERDEQVALARYLDLLGVVWWHTPNGGDRNRVVAARMRAEGVKAGVPDIVIASRVPNHPQARGVAIELKRRRGGRVTTEQAAWLDRLRAEGWLCRVCTGWDQAVEWLEHECGWNPRRRAAPPQLSQARSGGEVLGRAGGGSGAGCGRRSKKSPAATERRRVSAAEGGGR